jgi:hypothetical protein
MRLFFMFTCDYGILSAGGKRQGHQLRCFNKRLDVMIKIACILGHLMTFYCSEDNG